MMKKNENKKNKLKEELIKEADEELEEIEEEKKDLIEEADEEIEEIEESEDEVKVLQDQLRRAVADYQNLEKRTEEKRSEWVMTSNASLIKKLIPVLDNLFLAQKHIKDDGLDLSIQKFLDVLKEEGVDEIKTKGEEFNPHLMECVSVQEGDENKVLEEVRKGFIMNDIVLRPAQVIVGGKN